MRRQDLHCCVGVLRDADGESDAGTVGGVDAVVETCGGSVGRDCVGDGPVEGIVGVEVLQWWAGFGGEGGEVEDEVGCWHGCERSEMLYW